MTIHVNSNIKKVSGNNLGEFLKYFLTILKLFVFVGFAGGLLFGIFQSIRRSSLNGFIDGILFGAMLALAIVPVLTVLDVIQKVKCYLKYRVIDFTIEQERSFFIKGQYTNVFRGLCEVLDNLEKIEIHKKNMEKGTIEAVAKRSWRSSGEDIKIILFRATENKVVVTLSSRPKISITVIDYCKNFENVETIKKNITRSFSIDLAVET